VLVALRQASYALHVMLPVFPLVNVREAEFPVLVRMVNAIEEALSLFFLRQVEEYFGPSAFRYEKRWLSSIAGW